MEEQEPKAMEEVGSETGTEPAEASELPEDEPPADEAGTPDEETAETPQETTEEIPDEDLAAPQAEPEMELLDVPDEDPEVQEDPELAAYEAALEPLTMTPANAYTPAAQRNLVASETGDHAYTPETQEEAQEETPPYEDGVVLYAREEGGFSLLDLDDTDAALAALGIFSAEEVWSSGGSGGVSLLGAEETVWYKAQVSGDVEETVAELEKLDGIVAAEPNYLYTSDNYGEPTEVEKNKNEYFNFEFKGGSAWNKVWHDKNANPGEGSVVAVIDTGVDYTHPDLMANMWVNSAELNGTPDVDDDGNGYIDDIYGINATITNPNAKAGDPMDDNGHGTHVAGIIGMSSNGQGGVGIAYGAKIMAIKAGQSTGSLDSASIARAISYAKAMGADVINMSFGGTGKSSMVEDALEDAFSSCVLVAAAGNDGVPTTDAPDEFMKKENIYPAAYSYVLGVMATDKSGNLAGFSNWDYYGNANAEYEMTAPGVEIYSTLPGDRYAKWSGTSMAAPCVAAAAAVLRGYYFDKGVYSSRFIMGQLVSASQDKTTYVDKLSISHTYGKLNLLDSLTNLPKPNLSVSKVFAMDNKATSEVNDGDRILDAGETVDLGVQVRNQWGQTGKITVKANAISIGGVAHPYVEFIKDTVTLSPAGTFANSDNGFHWTDSYLDSVTNPIQFKLAADTPNDTEICINLTITTTNGWDTSDTNEYSTKAKFTFRVQNGQAIRGHVTEDTTLTADKYWIVENSLLIDEGVTLTVEPGTQIQFWSSDYEGAYPGMAMAYINNKGTLNMIGTEDKPIQMFPGAGFERYAVEISGSGVETLKYCEIINPRLGYNGSSNSAPVESCDHCDFTQNYSFVYIRYLDGGSVETNTNGHNISYHGFNVKSLTNSKLHDFRWAADFSGKRLYVGHESGNLYDNCSFKKENSSVNGNQTNNVFLGYATDFGEGTAILRLKQMPKTVPSYEAPITYDGAASKYVFVDPYNYEHAWELMHAAAGRLGGTLLCLNDKTEEDFIFGKLREMAEAERTDENPTGCISKCAYIGYTYDQATPAWQWEDGKNYTPTAYKSLNSVPYSYLWIESYLDRSYHNLYGTSSFRNSSYYYILEFPATCSDEKIISALENFDYAAWLKAYYTPYTTNCAILNTVLDTNPNHWTHFTAPAYTSDAYYNLSGNYWGTEDSELIRWMIVDDDRFTGALANIVETPILTLDDDLSDIYPFVTHIWLTDTEGHEVETATPGVSYTVHVTFNRDMDKTVDPMITYGPAEPYTDYQVSGVWVDAREWQGDLKLSVVGTDGTQFFRAKGGRAADDTWLVCGTDVLRFAFDVETTSVQTMQLNAAGGANKVELSWWQNDYETLAGYNLYRSTSETGSYTQINSSILTGQSYTDTDVLPGVTYYYYFKVLDTDGNELGQSNIASAAPRDNIKPTLTHTAVTSAKAGQAITISAKATDNIAVTAVKVFYRVTGASAWQTLELTKNPSVNGLYFGAIPAESVTAAGVEYYVEAYDGDGNAAASGTAENPIRVTVDTAPVLYGVNNPYVKSGDTVTLTGANLTADMTLTLGGKTVTFTFVSATEVTFTAPVMAAGSYALKVTATDGKTAELQNALKYLDTTSYVQLGSGVEIVSGSTGRIPLYVGAADAVTSFYAELRIPTAQFQTATAVAASDSIPTPTVNYQGGVLKITVASSGNIKPSDGPIVYVELKPRAVSAETTADIEMTAGRINGADARSIQGCTVTLLPNFTLTANVGYYKGTAKASGVTVTAAGVTGTTDTNGQAVLTSITRPDVTVTVRRTDPSISSAINAHDATLVLQSVVGLTTLDEQQRIAADLNGDGNVNEADAVVILQMAVRKIETETWAFVPASKAVNFGSTGTASVTFTAILLGDVDGSWTGDPQ